MRNKSVKHLYIGKSVRSEGVHRRGEFMAQGGLRPSVWLRTSFAVVRVCGYEPHLWLRGLRSMRGLWFMQGFLGCDGFPR